MSRGSKVVDAKSDLELDSVASGVHHIGVSVASRDDALAFWESFLGRKATWRTRLDRPYLGEIIGIPGVEIDGAFIDLPGGVILELLEYQTADRRANPPATANPGNVHICLAVEDADAAWRRASIAERRPSAAKVLSRSTTARTGARASRISESTTA